MSIVASRDAFGTIALHGDLDLASAPEMRRALDDDAVVTVDMSQVDFLGAAALRVLVDVQQRRTGRRSLRVVRASRAAKRTLELAGLLEAFVVPDDR